MKRYSISLTFREAQIKTTMRYYYTNIRWVKKNDNIKSSEDVGKLPHSEFASRNLSVNDTATLENSSGISYKKVFFIFLQPNNLTPGHLSHENENLCPTKMYHGGSQQFYLQ